MDAAFEVSTAVGDRGHVVVRAVGEIDMANVDEFAAECRSALAHHNVSRLTIDLRGVAFFGSAAIAVLMQTRGRLDGTADFEVLASGPVANVLHITNVSDYLNVR